MKKVILSLVIFSSIFISSCKKYLPDEQVVLNPSEHMLGDTSKASVIVVTYMAPGSPYCALFKNTMVQIVADNNGKVAWVYKHALLNLHPDDRLVARSMECISDLKGQTMFWRSVDSFYNNQIVTNQRITKIAASCTVDSVKFWSSVYQDKYQTKFTTDSLDFVRDGALGVPHSVLHNKRGQTVVLPGAYPIGDVQNAITSLF